MTYGAGPIASIWAILPAALVKFAKFRTVVILSRSTKRDERKRSIMQSPIDPIRLLGRHSTVQTSTTSHVGTIVAAGNRGVDISTSGVVTRVPASEVLAIIVQ